MQTDLSSCGICVCIVSEKLCDFLLNNKTICPTDKILYSFKFRHLIAFNLFARSMQCSQLMNAAAEENYYKTAIGLTNIGNTCWFNPVIQAVTAVLKISSQKIDNSNLNADMMILANIINTLLKHEPVNDKILQNAVVSVCNFCKFEFGKEQDPEEFFALSSLTDLLSVNGLSCISQLQVDIQCTSCNNVAHESATEQSDISVPVSRTVERGNDLQEYTNAHFSKEESKVCKKCNRQTKHVSRTQFHKLPNLLVIRLDRGTYKPGFSISKDNTTVALNQVFFCKTKQRNTFANISLCLS